MNTSPTLLAAAALALALTGCAATEDTTTQISKPGADVTRQSQPFRPDPPCLHRPCPR